MKFYRKPDLDVLYQVCIFRADRKTKMAAQISTSTLQPLKEIQLSLKNDLNVLYQVCVFGPIRKQNY